MSTSTNIPSDETVDLFVTVSDLIDSHGLDAVLVEIANHLTMESEDPDNRRSCQQESAFMGLEVLDLVDRHERLMDVLPRQEEPEEPRKASKLLYQIIELSKSRSDRPSEDVALLAEELSWILDIEPTKDGKSTILPF